MIKHFNSNIQNIILRELFKAQSSIKIAVAWLTNDLLFQLLLLKLQTGVRISLITNFDDINFSDNNDVDFSNFVKLGGDLHLNKTKTLMHDKFCIIDDNTIITGTYNWTNKAEQNDESVMVISADANLTSSYISMFNDLSNKYVSINIRDTVTRQNKNDKQISPLDVEPFCNMYRVNGFIKIIEDHETPENAIIVVGQLTDDTEDNYYETVLDYKTLQPILPYEYTDSCHMNTKDGTIWLGRNNRYALYNVRLKKFLTLFSFTYVTNWWRNYYLVKLNGRYGICNSRGEIVIPCEYDAIDNRRDITRGITQKDGRYGFIDSNSVILPAICDTISVDGKPSKVGNKYGLLSDGFFKDINGQTIILGKPALDFDYDEIKFHRYIDYEIGNFYVMRQGKNYGLYVPSKGILIPCSNGNNRFDKLDEELIIRLLHYEVVLKYKR